MDVEAVGRSPSYRASDDTPAVEAEASLPFVNYGS